jgi:hypothetical protein
LADFLGDRRLGQSTCKTQQHYSAGKAKGRLDVVLLARSGTLQAVIENKVEAELKKHQTKTYDRFNEIGKRCRKGCVTVQAALAFAGRPNQ